MLLQGWRLYHYAHIMTFFKNGLFALVVGGVHCPRLCLSEYVRNGSPKLSQY